MKSRILLVLAIVLGLGFAVQQLQAGQGVDAIQAQSMVSAGALLVDVREPAEYAAIHVQNAKLIPLGDVNSRAKEIEAFKNKPVVVMCRSGHRSAMAAVMLKQDGFTQVSSMEGGIQAWEQAGLPVVRQQ
jgi:rhodanese-related sulfurtransferase